MSQNQALKQSPGIPPPFHGSQDLALGLLHTYINIQGAGLYPGTFNRGRARFD